MGFLVISNVSSSFGLACDEYGNIHDSSKAWYNNPSLYRASSSAIQEIIDAHPNLEMSYAPSLIKGTKNVWYHCEGTEYYELNFIQSSNHAKSYVLDTHIFFYNGGTYVRQLPSSKSVKEQVQCRAFGDYLAKININADDIKAFFKQEQYSLKKTIGDFTVECLYAVDPKTGSQLLLGPTYLKVSSERKADLR